MYCTHPWFGSSSGMLIDRMDLEMENLRRQVFSSDLQLSEQHRNFFSFSF